MAFEGIHVGIDDMLGKKWADVWIGDSDRTVNAVATRRRYLIFDVGVMFGREENVIFSGQKGYNMAYI